MFQSASGLSVGGRGGEKCRRWRLRQSTCQATPRADFIAGEPRPQPRVGPTGEHSICPLSVFPRPELWRSR